jgi:predicted nucleic acid-binding protein
MGRSQEAERVVVNASVMLAVLILDEPWIAREGSMRLLQEIEDERLTAFVPDRFLDEVLGGVLKALAVQRPLLITADEIFHFLSRIPFIWCREGEIWRPEDVWATAQEFDCPYADAIYIQLARQHRATLWTADMRLVRNLRRRRFPARWIGEIIGR